MAEWVKMCRLDELPAGRGLAREVLGLRVALFREGNTAAALGDRCPHAGGSLGQGWIAEGEVVCPLHRWQFRLRDGRCTTIPGERVHRFPVQVRDGDVWVLV